MPTENQDANTPPASSAGNNPTGTPAKGTSSNPPGETIASVARRIYDASQARSQGAGHNVTGTESEEGSNAGRAEETEEERQNEGETGEQGERGEADGGEGDESASAGDNSNTGDDADPNNRGEGSEAEAGAANEETEEVPFHDHPRFKQLLTERNTLKQKEQTYLEKVAAAEARLKGIEPLAKAAYNHNAFVTKHRIPPDAVAAVMNALAFRHKDPVKAKAILEPLWNEIASADGSVLLTDLATEVEEGTLSPTRAVEIAQLRAKQKGIKIQQQEVAESRQQTLQESIDDAVATWEQAAAARLLNFKPKADANAPEGLWDLTVQRFVYEQQMRPINHPMEVKDRLDAALKWARGLLKTKATPTRQLPKSTDSVATPGQTNSNSNKEPKTVSEVVNKIVREHQRNKRSFARTY